VFIHPSSKQIAGEISKTRLESLNNSETTGG